MKVNKRNPIKGYERFELCGYSYWTLNPEDDDLYPHCHQFKDDFKGVYCCIGCEKFRYWRELLGIK